MEYINIGRFLSVSITRKSVNSLVRKNIGNYNGLATLFSAGDKPVIAYCEDNRKLDQDGETKLVVLNGNFRAEATYKLDHYYTAFFDLFDGKLLARSGNTIYLMDYEKNDREAYIDRLLSGLNETAMLLIGADSFIAKDAGTVKLVYKGMNATTGGILTLATYSNSFRLNRIVGAYNSSGRVAAISEHSFGILAGSTLKEGAWDFFEFMTNEEYLASLSDRDSFSIVDSVFKTQLDGQEALLLEQEPPLTFVTANCSIEVNVEPHEMKRALISLVERIDCTATCDDAVFNIITEATGLYFAGDKTADEVADVIQSSMAVYLAEQYARCHDN